VLTLTGPGGTGKTRLAVEAGNALADEFPDGTYFVALDAIRDGRTYPILYNDDVNVPAVMQSLDVGRADAEQYVPFGCGELIVEHRGLGTPSGVLNLLKALEVTLHDGVDPITGRRIGLALGRLSDLASFDDLWRAYTRQVEHFVRLAAEQAALEYRVAGEEWSALLMSMLTDDCLSRGRGTLEGGVRFLGATLETYGNTNAADSLTAIDELVFRRRELAPERLLDALAASFPAASVVMIGPVVKVDPATLPRRPNIHWLGQRPYAELPAYVKAFDVCLMPFALNEATEYINPTKTLEYLAAGRPVVSTAISDVVRHFSSVVRVATCRDAFVAAVAEELRAPDPARIARGIERAKGASWEAIVAEMRRLVARAVARRERASAVVAHLPLPSRTLAGGEAAAAGEP
jgi:glycosyltransferase involved in cell wall biosynthesis